MKFQAILGALASLSVSALAVPVDNVSERVVLRGDQIKSLTQVLHGKPDVLAPDQSISCNITYTLELSTRLLLLVFLWHIC